MVVKSEHKKYKWSQLVAVQPMIQPASRTVPEKHAAVVSFAEIQIEFLNLSSFRQVRMTTVN